MQKIGDLLSIKIEPQYRYEFEEENCRLGLSRIRILCFAFVILSFYFFYADIALYKTVNNTSFRKSLALIHIIGFIISSLYLLLYRYLINHFNIYILKIILRCCIDTLLLMGSISSINSQRLTGNIDAYIIFTIIGAVAFPFEPVFMFFSFLLNYILLITGLFFLSNNHYSFITKQINSTALLALSFLFCYSLYRSRAINLTNRYKLAKSESNLKKLFNVNLVPLLLSRYEDGQIIMANDRAYKFYGYTKEEFQTLFTKNLYKDEEDRFKAITKLNNSDKVENYIVEQKNKLGNTKWIIANYELVKYDDQDCILTSVTDITELKKMENELLDHASTDALTGVLNRRIGTKMLKDKMNISNNNHSLLTICFLDIDNLKFINDTFGHSEGDFLISKIISVVRDSINSTDILFRYGGDEFIIVFPDKNEQFVETIWNKTKYELNRLNDEELKPYKFSISHGVFQYNGEDNLTAEAILQIADKRMYIEKTNKKMNKL